MEYFLAFIALVIIFDSNEPQTEIVLLNNGKTQNEIIIKNKDKKITINKPNTFISINQSNGKVSKLEKISQKDLMEKYGDIISQSSIKPVSKLFYFLNGLATLTPDSQKNLKYLLPIIKTHSPCDITIIGHSDRAGDDKLNLELSLKRAKVIKDWLITQNIKIDNLKIESYGETDPIIPTKDGVSEPRNRRVEVLIK